MKILIALHQCMDLGGIINHTEQLIGGLKDIGHTVDLMEMVWSNKAPSQKKQGDWLVGPSGIPHDQGKGWNFPQSNRIPYRGSVGISGARQVLSQYDLVIWTVPVPPKNKNNTGNSDWPYLYDLPLKVKQIAFSHDGNSKKGYPYITHIQHHLSAIACVHHCSFNSAEFINVPRYLILNPQSRPVREVVHWQDKCQGFFNMQTFKAWKQAHELIQSIAYMPDVGEREYRLVAGQGIEYRYMVSEDKCKDKYYHDDPGQWFDGMKFWDAAEANGMKHDGYVDNIRAAEILDDVRILVDPSWSNNYSQRGGHYNRVLVDAMIHGCVPVARIKGVGTDLFKPGMHYVAIPEDATPEEYADVILSASSMSKEEAENYRVNALNLLGMFDRQAVAEKLIESAFAEGVSEHLGETPQSVYDKAEEILFNHFGIV